MCSRKIEQMHDVFIPGGFPTITYISRHEKRLEEEVAQAKKNLGKLVVVTGATKLGKTVLVNKVFPQVSEIWIEGGSVESLDDIWEPIIEKGNQFPTTTQSKSKSKNIHMEGTLTEQGTLFVIGAKADETIGHTTETESSWIYQRDMSKKTIAIQYLINTKNALIIDDFHYIHKDLQKRIVRALKSPIMQGVPVVFIAIPNRKYDVVEVEREMTGRIKTVEMPVWTVEELENIPKRGFEALNVNINEALVKTMTVEAYGSPFLMQDFCREICKKEDILETLKEPKMLCKDYNLKEIFECIAEASGRSMFDKLKKGPRARSDRKNVF